MVCIQYIYVSYIVCVYTYIYMRDDFFVGYTDSHIYRNIPHMYIYTYIVTGYRPTGSSFIIMQVISDEQAQPVTLQKQPAVEMTICQAQADMFLRMKDMKKNGKTCF